MQVKIFDILNKTLQKKRVTLVHFFFFTKLNLKLLQLLHIKMLN